MRNLRLILISAILVLAVFCTLAGCMANGANASPVLNDGEGEEYLFTYVILGDAQTAETADGNFLKLATNATPDNLNLTTLKSPNQAYNPGFAFGGWYFTKDNVSGKPVSRMTTDEFFALAEEYGTSTETNPNTIEVKLYAKWVSTAVTDIDSVEGLIAVRNNLAGSYRLVKDIDLDDFDHYAYADEHVLDIDDYNSEEEMREEADKLRAMYQNSWIPIAGGVGEEFIGHFDGNGYEIRGMEIVVTDHDADPDFNYVPVGLFGKVTGTVTNVNLVDYEIKMDGDASRFYVGGIAGWVQKPTGENINKNFPGTYSLTGNTQEAQDSFLRKYPNRIAFAGAIGTIINYEIEYTGNMWDSLFGSYAEPTSQVYYGGIVGFIDEANVVSAFASGSITSESNADEVYLGGVAGFINKGSLTKSNANVYVRGRYAGGLAGYNNGKISYSYALGNAEGSLSYPAIAGGLVAYNFTEGSINNCYAEGNVKARTAGGLVGVNIFDYVTAAGGTVRDTYAKGNVFASEYAGGLIGRASADLPIFGREDFHSSIFNNDDFVSNIENNELKFNYAIIERCLAFGTVEANATETEFKDDKGEIVNASVYYSVFAGGLVGQAYEQLVRGCVSYGDVSAISNRPKGNNANDITHNTAFAGNLVGHSTNMVVDTNYLRVYTLDSVEVKRNGEMFVGTNIEGEMIYPNTAVTQSKARLNDATFYYNGASLGFSMNDWNCDGLDIENGIYPTLKGV